MVRNSGNASGAILNSSSVASEIDGVKLIQIKNSTDSRGSFLKLHPSYLLDQEMNSVALSINPKVGTIRGIHLQVEPFAEEKIITCIQGSTFEVIVDVRPNSKSFGLVATFELSQQRPEQIYLPKGIAHGFQTLLPNTIVHYFLTSQFSPESSYSIDPFGALDIRWPIIDQTVSEKDTRGVTFEFAAQKYAESLNS
jgi:dTDP-4-dehydrorhamnose 3,5-epimerase